MKIPLFYIDAFTSDVFKGNPAAVCFLDSWLPSETLQAIAAEHNLSETAFIVKEEKEVFQLKWFTPITEVPLCGHATLAAAHVIFSIYDFGPYPIRFKTKSGILPVKKDSGGRIILDFPSYDYQSIPFDPLWNKALGCNIKEAYDSFYTMFVIENESDVLNLKPEFNLLKKLDSKGTIITAPGKDSDFVSRFFAPSCGILEDPVTGSAHCVLIPYWSKRLSKKQLFARQLSERTGELWCYQKGDRVEISGLASTYMQGTITLKGKPVTELVLFEFSE